MLLPFVALPGSLNSLFFTSLKRYSSGFLIQDCVFGICKCAATISITLLGMSSLYAAYPIFNHNIEVNSESGLRFHSATVYGWNSEDYFDDSFEAFATIQGYVGSNSEESDDLFPAVARFTESGDVAWSVYANYVEGEVLSSFSAVADFSMSDQLFVSAVLESGALAFGKYNANTRQAIFEKSILTENGRDFRPSSLALGAYEFAVQWVEGASLALKLFDEDGSDLWEKHYSHASLTDDAEGGSEDLEFQLFPDPLNDGYLIHADNYIGTESTPVSNNHLLAKLDESGNVNWAKTFTRDGVLASAGPSVTFMQATFDGGWLMFLPDYDLLQQSNRVYLLKLSSTGELEWAKVMEGVAFTLAAYSLPEDANERVWFSGLKTAIGLGSVAFSTVLVGIDIETGEKVAETELDMGSSILTISRVTEDSLFGTALSVDNPGRIDVVRLDYGLTEAQGYRRSDGLGAPGLVVSGGQVAFLHEFDAETGSIGITSVDETLAPASGACATFTPFEVELLESDSEYTDLDVLLVDTQVTVTVENTATGDASFELYELPLAIVDCEGQVLSGDGSNGGGGGDAEGLSATFELEAGGQLNLAVESEAGFSYELMYSPDLVIDFEVIGTQMGTGEMLVFEVHDAESDLGFYRIRKTAP